MGMKWEHHGNIVSMIPWPDNYKDSRYRVSAG
jgi:hypothetical protein